MTLYLWGIFYYNVLWYDFDSWLMGETLVRVAVNLVGYPVQFIAVHS
jgi:hypothetical protein